MYCISLSAILVILSTVLAIFFFVWISYFAVTLSFSIFYSRSHSARVSFVA